MIDMMAFAWSAVAALIFLSLIFLIARIKDRFDLIDVAWGLVFIVIAYVGFNDSIIYDDLSAQTLVTFLVTVWGLRLSYHIFERWRRSKTEDGRYQDMRVVYSKKPGGLTLNMYIRVFVVQALLAVTVSAPVIVLNSSENVPIGWLAIVGAAVWLVGFVFESLGDWQLREHLNDSKTKGKLMTSGLWRYTRHPNYFGEVVQWWGIAIIALSVPLWWVSLIGPAIITYLILFVSGVALTEKRFAGRPGWNDYKQRTSIFLPLPPKST